MSIGNFIHGHRTRTHRSKEYAAWSHMTQRCNNPNHPRYKHYGGRGIKVCERWLKFENFLADVGLAPSPKHTIDRFPNNDGDYEPDNFRWATYSEQNKNRRKYNRRRRITKNNQGGDVGNKINLTRVKQIIMNQEEIEIPKYVKEDSIIYDWCLYNGEKYFAVWNYEESERRGKLVIDLAYCATKAMNGIFLKQRVWSKRFQPIGNR